MRIEGFISYNTSSVNESFFYNYYSNIASEFKQSTVHDTSGYQYSPLKPMNKSRHIIRHVNDSGICDIIINRLKDNATRNLEISAF